MSAKPNQVLAAEASPVVAASASTLLQVIERAASNPQADIDKMERLMAMHERLVAREAEAAFNEALAQCQSAIGRIAADARNDQTKSNYATYAKLDKVLRPIYTGHGFAISYTTAPLDKPDVVRVVAHVSRGAHTRTYQMDMPADGKGAKGGDVMTKTHATGAAMAYGMRYLLKGIFNVAIGEEDTDGNHTDTRMPDEKVVEWIEKIKATTTKEKAKEVWHEAVTAAKTYGKGGDAYAAKRLKEELIAHGEFIDQAGK